MLGIHACWIMLRKEALGRWLAAGGLSYSGSDGGKLECGTHAQVEVTTPEEHMGDVIGDLNSRRGLVGEFLDKPGNMRVSNSRQSWISNANLPSVSALRAPSQERARSPDKHRLA